MKKIYSLIIAVVFSFGLVACKGESEVKGTPEFTGVENTTVFIGEAFDLLDGIGATDKEDGDLASSVLVDGIVDFDTAGEYEITYSVTDSDGNTTTVTRVITVASIPLANGWHNYKFADPAKRLDLMAAAEKYLLDTMTAGVPLFSNSGNVMFSERMNLPVEQAVPIMGFSELEGSMTADDSTVTMIDGAKGNSGEFTYRHRVSADAGTLNQWEYNTSTESTLLGYMQGSLYKYILNDTKTSYSLVPSLAASLPTPKEGTTSQVGAYTVSKVWQIELRDNLEWAYNDATNTTGFDNAITADDFLYTWELALREEWMRSCSGGGDFCSKEFGVKNAREYNQGEITDFSEVGFKKISDTVIEIEFLEDKREWDVRYGFGSMVQSPVHEQLYERHGELYGTEPHTVAYSGDFILDNWVKGEGGYLGYIKNVKSPDAADNFYTGLEIPIIKSTETAFNEFKAGKLDYAAVPNAEYENFKNDPRMKTTSGATTFRLMINGLGNVENQKEQFEGSTYTPEPILSDVNFKKAMYYAVDRQSLVDAMKSGASPQIYLFSNSYVVDAVEGSAYRGTEQGQSVGEGQSESTFGYNKGVATAYFKEAVTTAIANGDYVAGTESNPTVIDIDLLVFASSEAQIAMGEFLKKAYEDTFVDEDNHVKVNLNIKPTDFPGIYYNHMMVGEFDISIGGISGSTLNAASFLDTYCSDNRGYFTLNWGIDTTKPEILYDGELWSFDALQSALNGEVYVRNGMEAVLPAPKNVDATHNTLTFTITEFNNNDYSNIRYTIQKMDEATGMYVDVEGLVDVVPSSNEVTITDLDHSSDYNIIVSYTIIEGDIEETVTATVSTSDVFTLVTDSIVATETGATLAVELTDVTVASARVLDSEGVALESATVDFANLETVIVTGLEADTTYTVEFTLSDGAVRTVEITTLIPV